MSMSNTSTTCSVPMSNTSRTRSTLTVQTSPNGKIVYYKVFDDADTHSPKLARYSELARLHQQIVQEVPTFQGVFPPKKWRNTRVEFIETRRSMIEQYLRSCVSDVQVKDSKAFSAFWDSDDLDSNIDLDSTIVRAVTLKSHDLDSNIDLDSTIVRAVTLKSQSKLLSLDAVKEKKAAVEGQLTHGQSTLEGITVEAASMVATEREALVKLQAHYSSIEELENDMLAKKATRLDVARAKAAECRRLEECLAVAMEATKKSQASFMATQNKRIQISADNKTKNMNASNKVSVGNAAHAAALEHLNATKQTMAALSEGVAARQQDARTAQIEREVCQNALTSLQKELDEAEEGRKRVSDMLTRAEAAKASFIKESAGHKRSLENELNQAKERAMHAAALRDMPSREMVTEGDSKALEKIQKMVLLSAETTSKALSDASSALERSNAADANKTTALQADCDKFAKDLRVWEVLCSQLVSRYAENERELEAATMACAASDAAVQVLLDAHQTIKSKVEGALKASVEDYAAKLQAARQAVVETRKKGDVELASARYADQAESVALKQAEAAEAHLAQMLDEARTLCAVPPEDEDATTCTDFKDNILLSSAKADHAACQHAANQAQEASRQAPKAVAAAEAELAEAVSEEDERRQETAEKQMAEGEEVDDCPVIEMQRISALHSRLEDLKQTLVEKRVVELAAQTAVDDMTAELEALEGKERSMLRPTLCLLEAERAMIDQCISAHETQEASLMGDSSKRAADWQNRKVALEEELLRANLQMKTVNTEVSTFKRITNRLN